MNFIKKASPKTKIAIMTAGHVDDLMKKTIDITADYFLAKPFDLSEIRLLSRSALGSADISREYDGYESGFGRERRQFTRKPIRKEFNFSVNVLEHGKLKDLCLTGDIVDISEQGMGISIDYPLEPGHLLRFAGGMEKKAGIARWRMLVGSRNEYRVGIQFV
jgi:hypothetical protein